MDKRTRGSLAGITALGVACAAALAASQPAKPPRGARVAIVAYHDSRLLTLCPVLGKNVIESAIFQTGMKAAVSVFYPPAPRNEQRIVRRIDDRRLDSFILPMPAGRTATLGPAPLSSATSDLDRLARDLDLEQRIAGQFRTRAIYPVVDSPVDADFVFLAESYHLAYSLGTAAARPTTPVAASIRDGPERIFSDAESEWRRRTEWLNLPLPAPHPPARGAPGGRSADSVTVLGEIGGDRHLSWRDSILAIAVPAGVFRENHGDGEALSAGRLWQGVAATVRGRPSVDGSVMKAASPEELVDRFHARNEGLPDYLPVCAATPGVIRAIDDPGETIRNRPSPGETADPAVPLRPEGAGGRGAAQFRSRVTLVTLPVTVTDRGGAPLRDLPIGSFRIFEDGVEQKVERLDTGAVAADVALLVDSSAGMREPRESIRSSAPALATALRAADRAMVVKFASQIRVLAEPTSDRLALQRALAATGPGGGTRLYDALALMAVDRLRTMDGRKAVILVTDGLDTQSQLTNRAGALAAMEATNTPVYVIRYETADAGGFMPPTRYLVQRWLLAPPERAGKTEMARTEADQFLLDLSSGTGGQLYAALPDADIPGMIAHIAEDLSNQQVLGYYPANDRLDGSYRRIRVIADCEGCTVRAREGYRAGILR